MVQSRYEETKCFIIDLSLLPIKKRISLGLNVKKQSHSVNYVLVDSNQSIHPLCKLGILW